MSDHCADKPVIVFEEGTATDVLADRILELIAEDGALDASQRRARPRYPICCWMQVRPIPADEDTEEAAVVGKDLSTTGICFSHELPLEQGQIIISLQHERIGHFCVEAEVVWTRQTPLGLYESGCRFLRKLPEHTLLFLSGPRTCNGPRPSDPAHTRG